ncbi:MAG TPA: CTP synthase, partial [Verrucomicrobiae bacterium]|nr:CTP synthase [Verrucomicrobiae bacterium]
DTARVAEQLTGYHGILCACGSPYQSMTGALAAIRYARENDRVFMGNCGGFQHMVIEFARNVLGIAGGEHEETSPEAPTLIINRLSCSLVGRTETVRMLPGSRLREVYRNETATEGFWCSFGVNPEYVARLEAGGFRVQAVDGQEQVRAAELAGHQFFLGTLFIPGISSTEASPHPVVTAFVKAAAASR